VYDIRFFLIMLVVYGHYSGLLASGLVSGNATV